MAKLNKYGELDSINCPSCGNTIKPHWKMCPECGTPFQKTTEGKPASSGDRFTCPGCGEPAKAKDSDLCNICNAFVHNRCQKGPRAGYFDCPVCGGHLKKACFISTAAASELGWDDDGPEMSLLRHFRDTYMQETDARIEEVKLYYHIAPQIVSAVSRGNCASQVWKTIGREYLQPAVQCLRKEQLEEAHVFYRRMVNELSERWLDGGR